MTLTINLPPEVEARLEAEAARRGVALPEYALDILKQSVIPHEARIEETSGESILRLVERLHATMPEGAWEGVPRDLAKNYKHYLYGHPKEEE